MTMINYVCAIYHSRYLTPDISVQISQSRANKPCYAFIVIVGTVLEKKLWNVRYQFLGPINVHAFRENANTFCGVWTLIFYNWCDNFKEFVVTFWRLATLFLGWVETDDIHILCLFQRDNHNLNLRYTIQSGVFSGIIPNIFVFVRCVTILLVQNQL